MIDLDKLFRNYKVKRFRDENIDEIFSFCMSNPMYYEICGSTLTHDNIRSDLKLVPEGVDIKDKYYIGLYDDDRLICIIDFVDNYPEKGYIFIGFFMVDGLIGNKGIGSNIIDQLVDSFKKMGYKSIRLAYDRENPQSSHFWKKNGFVKIGEKKHEYGNMIIAERML